MIKALTYVALVITILAGSAVLYRHQPYQIRMERRAGEVKKDQEQASVPKVLPSPAFGPVPNVVVQAIPAETPRDPHWHKSAEAQEQGERAVAKKSVEVRKRKPKPSAAKKLKSKWVAPDSFKLEDLFNAARH